MTKPLCVVLGIGPKNGAAFARKFAREGYQLAPRPRSAASLSRWRVNARPPASTYHS
jgi:hypothetical protein